MPELIYNGFCSHPSAPALQALIEKRQLRVAYGTGCLKLYKGNTAVVAASRPTPLVSADYGPFRGLTRSIARRSR